MDETKIPENLLSDLILLEMPSDPVKSLKSIQKAKTHSSRIKTPFDGNANDEGAATRSHELLSVALSAACGKMNPPSKKKSVKFDPNSAGKGLTPPTRTESASNEDDRTESPFDFQPKNTNRKEILVMKQAMLELLHKLDDASDRFTITQHSTASDLDSLLQVITEEQKLYDTVFQEMIRQITAHMLERGEILAEVRVRYSNLFQRIPKHVKQIYVEAVGHRKLVQRLLQELNRSREETKAMILEVEVVRQHDRTVASQTKELESKLVSLMAEVEGHEDIIEEYHRLYRMQRDRLEQQLKVLEKEKTLWMDSTSNMVLRVAKDHDIVEISLLQRKEHERMLASNHILSYIVSSNEKEMEAIDQEVDAWRKQLYRVSVAVLQEDRQDIDRLTNVLRSVKQMYHLVADTDFDSSKAESGNPILAPLQLYDTKKIIEELHVCLLEINDVSDRYTTDKDLQMAEDLRKAQAMAEHWIDLTRKTLHRCEHGVNSKEFHDRLGDLRVISDDISAWLKNLQQRLEGENGIAVGLISLQNVMEDRHNSLVGRGQDKPLTLLELTLLKESFDKWRKDLAHLITVQSKGSDSELAQVSARISKFFTRISEQMQTDSNLRHEENLNLHSDMTKWMVRVIELDADLQKSCVLSLDAITHELSLFNQNVSKDAGGLEIKADDHQNLHDVIKIVSMEWIDVAKALLEGERKRRAEKNGPPPPTTVHRNPDDPPYLYQTEDYRTTSSDLADMEFIEEELNAIMQYRSHVH